MRATAARLLHTLLDNIPDTIYFKDTESRFTRINKAHALVLGLDRPEEAVGKTDFDFYPEEQARQAYEDEQQLVRSGEPLLDQVEGRWRAGQLERWVSATKVPIKDAHGRVVGIVGISRDITDRRRAEEELRRTAEELARSNAALEEFAYVASHDLQEPLRKIMAFGERLAATCGAGLPPQGRDYLERMQSAAQRMQNLINALLAYSRVTTRGQPFVAVDLGEVAREVLADLEASIEQTGASVHVGHLPVIEADPTQMRQLLQNLAGNALKFHREDEPPRVLVHGRVLEERDAAPAGPCSPGTMCQIAVEDNGIGFDEKYLDCIFGVFQRLHGRGVYAGTGMGLAICRKIADRHGGSITAASTLGRGSVFTVVLPVRQNTAGGDA